MSDDPEADENPAIPLEAFKSLGEDLGAHLAEHHPGIDFVLILVDDAGTEKSKCSMIASGPLFNEMRICADQMESTYKTYKAGLMDTPPGDLN